MNKLVLIAAGGAGCNIAREVVPSLNRLGDGFVETEVLYIDTSDKDFNVEEDGEIWLVENQDNDGKKISGSGGERSTNAQHIEKSVKAFLDKNNIKKKETGVYYIVMFSLSGGTGSITSPYIIMNMFAKNIPVAALCVADTSSLMLAENSLKSLATLESIAKKYDKPLNIMYANNTANGKDSMEAEKLTNESIYSSLCTLSLFLSGDNSSLDEEDMLNIIDQSNFKTSKVPAGLYSLVSFSKDVTIPSEAFITVARTLTVDNVSPMLKVKNANEVNEKPKVHAKYGNVLVENAKNIYKNQFPIHLISITNMLNTEVTALNDTITKYKDELSKVVTGSIFTKSIATEVMDDGIVL